MGPLVVAAVSYGGELIVKHVTPEMIAKGAKLAFFFAKGLNDQRLSSGKKIHLSKKVHVLENELSVPRSFVENQYVGIGREIKDDLTVIKGQNEILFLSNSIDYFLRSHSGRVGIDQSISYALQYDISAVVNYVKSNQQLRFPGYILHQSAALACTIRDYNLFYDSILNGGHVREWTRELVEEELNRSYGPNKEKNPVPYYMPYEHQVGWMRDNSKRKAGDSKWKIPFVGSNDEILDEAHDCLVVLAKELMANEALERRLLEKITSIFDGKVVILSGDGD